MSVREIWQRLSLETILSLPPSELLSVVLLVVIGAFAASVLLGAAILISRIR